MKVFRRTITRIGTILLALLPILGSAQNQHEALVQELYVKSGLAKQLQQVPLLIQASLDQPLDDFGQKLPESLISTMKALVPWAFALENLKKPVLQELREKLITPDIKEVLKWLDSPLGKKITQMEEAAATLEAQTAIDQYAMRMKSSPPTAARLKVIAQLDAASKATESAVELAVNTQIAVSLAINATLPREQQMSPAEIKRQLAKDRPDLEAAAKMQTVAALFYTYRTLTESEIQKYIEFLRSPAGSKFTSVSTVAIDKAFYECNIKWGKAIGETLKQGTSRSEV